ncbi:hypothetical protein IP81_13190 [Novosphingobium sp. AAP83]|nr:hypothetical protein IP81_13190 [Novosphingobium sp. AAP83]
MFTAVSNLTLDDYPVLNAWDDLDALSSRTIFEGIEAIPGGIVFDEDGHFEVAATIYVTLNYGGSRDEVSMSDSYPAMIYGKVDDLLNVDISECSFDTHSFYSDE